MRKLRAPQDDTALRGLNKVQSVPREKLRLDLCEARIVGVGRPVTLTSVLRCCGSHQATIE